MSKTLVNLNRTAPKPSKAATFRHLLTAPDLAFLCEAHDGLSARIVEEAGFRGIWASGLSMSAALGVRDSNEASWTQILEVAEFMADATSVPIMLDGDTGYGNFNNMRRLVQKLESRDIAAVCIEDKLFPKTNSFINGGAQPLADIDEFCGKIRAGKAAQRDPDFSIVARVEAFIAGWGLDEALRRAESYAAAGADAILMHSAKSSADEVLAFLDAWGGRAPVILVPTKYYTTPTEIFRAHGASVVIWANHIVRASIAAMQKAATEIRDADSVLGIEDTIVPVSEVFRLQGAAELEQAERLYLPAERTVGAVVLAASQGRELGALTDQVPKAMLEVAGKPLLGHIVDTYRRAGVKDITVVRGFAKQSVAISGIATVDNDDFESSQEVTSLACALRDRQWDGDLLISYGDVLFRRHILEMLADALPRGDAPDGPTAAIVIDTNWRDSRNRSAERLTDLVSCSLGYGREAFSGDVSLVEMIHQPAGRIDGEWMGVVRFTAAGGSILRDSVARWLADDAQGFAAARMNDLFNRLIAEGHTIKVVYTTGHWIDIDHVDDLVFAASFV